MYDTARACFLRRATRRPPHSVSMIAAAAKCASLLLYTSPVTGSRSQAQSSFLWCRQCASWVESPGRNCSFCAEFRDLPRILYRFWRQETTKISSFRSEIPDSAERDEIRSDSLGLQCSCRDGINILAGTSTTSSTTSNWLGTMPTPQPQEGQMRFVRIGRGRRWQCAGDRYGCHPTTSGWFATRTCSPAYSHCIQYGRLWSQDVSIMYITLISSRCCLYYIRDNQPDSIISR